MITYCGHRLTAHQLGKLIIWDKGEVGADYWLEDSSIEWDTLAEYEAILSSVEKQRERVTRFLRPVDWTDHPQRKRSEDPPRRPVPWKGTA